VLNLNVNTDYATDATVPKAPTDLLGTLAKTLGFKTSDLHPAMFAVQMVQGPDVLTFSKNPMPDPSAPSGS